MQRDDIEKNSFIVPYPHRLSPLPSLQILRLMFFKIMTLPLPNQLPPINLLERTSIPMLPPHQRNRQLHPELLCNRRRLPPSLSSYCNLQSISLIDIRNVADTTAAAADGVGCC